MFQIENSAGKPATDGWLEVYIHGTRTKYYCASNFDGTLHPFKIKLDSLGSNIVLADDGQAYDVYAYNRFGSLLMSRYNVQPGSGGSGSIITGEMQHWLGMYGPTYTHFPGDDAGHTLGIPRQSVDYDGDFIDHIETAPYPDGDVPAYIYLKPGLYHIDCVIRYQQDSDDIKNTLDEVLIYTGHGNANEDVAYQLDASGPETNGNRHCLKQSFIRKVTENDGSLLYFAPGTPTNWTDAYIQTLSIVKLDSMIVGKAGIPKVTHDDTMTGDGTPDSPLSIQDALDGKQDTLTPGEGITIDSDGNISSETYSEGWGIDIDENNVISVDPDIIQQKLTPGEGINIDSDGNISANEYTEGWGIDIDENNVISVDPDIIQQKLTPGDGIQIDSDGTITAEGEKYYEGWGIDINENNEISVDPDIIQKKITTGEGLTLDSDGNLNLDLPPIIPLVAGDGVTLTDSNGELIISAEGRRYTAGEGITIDGEGNISVDPNTVQEKLTAGQNIEIDSDGVISADVPQQEQADWEQENSSDPSYIRNKPDLSVYQKELTAGTGINLDSDGNIAVDTDVIQEKLTAGNGINIDGNDEISVDTSVVQEKLTAGQNIEIDSDGVISAAGAPTYTAGNGINIDGNNEISIDTTVVQEKLTAGQNIEIDSDGTISAELPSEEEVTFEEFDPDDYQTKLTAGQNITIDPNGVISATSEPCLWFLDSDGKITPKDGKHFEVYGAPSYTQVGQYYFKKAAKVQSNDSGFEIDGLLSSHTGSDTPYGNYGTVAKVYTEFAQDPYMGARRGGLVVKSFENSSVHPESRIDMYAGNDSGYGVENYKNKTYVQAVVGSDYVRMRSDDVVRHTGNSDSHAPFVSAQQSDTTKTYVMKPTSTTGVYDLVEESSGGGGGTTYTAGQGINIANDVISVDSDSVAMKSDLPSEEEVEFEEFNPENFTQQQINALKRVLGVDETVLYDNGTTTSATLSESMSNFERIKVFLVRGDGSRTVQELAVTTSSTSIQLSQIAAYSNNWVSVFAYQYSISGLTISPSSYIKELAFNTGVSAVTVRNTAAPTIVKVVGVHRISNS